FGPVVGDALGEAGGETAELFEAPEAAFDDVAAPVDVGVEAWWPAAGLALGLAPGDLVGPFWAGERDATRPQRTAGGGMRIGLVGDHPSRSAPWGATPLTAHAELVEQREELGVVASLAGTNEDGHGPAPAVDREVDLAGQSAPGPSEAFAWDGESFDPGGPGSPFFRAPAACWCA